MPIRLLITGTFCCLLGACALLPQPEVLPPDAEEPTELPAFSAGGTDYRIDQARLTLHTYRAGWLANLAHNHVMETSEITGRLRISDPIEASSGYLYYRPYDLILDDPAARRAAGAGFESHRSEADIAATRTRMLGPAGFHSNDHPFVIIGVGWADADHVALNIRLRGTDHRLTVPASWTIGADAVKAAADFELSHRALGLRPYSAFLGAIAVADRVRVQLELSAVRIRRTEPARHQPQALPAGGSGRL